MVELTEILFPINVDDKVMFDLLNSMFLALNAGFRNDIIRIVFEARAMALGGYGINLERCCSCGRPYTGAGRAVFMRDKGGIACLNCERESGLCPGMGPDAVKAMGRIQSGVVDGIGGIQMPETAIEEIIPVLKQHIEYRIGKRLRSAKYLD
jgi:DNA repair protein RecO (recombination protein O)